MGRILLLLGLLVLTGCDFGSPAGTPTPLAPTAAAPPAPTVAPILLQGEGELTTAPVPLAAGDYTLTWATTPPARDPQTSCWLSGSLVPTGPDSYPVGRFTNDAGKGSTAVYALAGGQYYLKVFTACAWTVTLTPRTP